MLSEELYHVHSFQPAHFYAAQSWRTQSEKRYGLDLKPGGNLGVSGDKVIVILGHKDRTIQGDDAVRFRVLFKEAAHMSCGFNFMTGDF